MANTGYISSSGINQIFTTGPYSGSIVTSSYASGGILLGPTISYYEEFISGSEEDTGSINFIEKCDNLIFERYYFDPILCPLGDCISPTIIAIGTLNCENYNFDYILTYNSGSTNAEYSTIEYSTISDFSFNTGSLIVTNSIGLTSSINVSNLSLLPLPSTPVYFRIFNSCSIGGTSMYSNIESSSCLPTPEPITPSFTIRLKNTSGNIIYYINDNLEYSLFNNTQTDIFLNDLNPKTIPFRTLLPDNEVRTIFISGSTPSFNGLVISSLNDDTPTYNGDIIFQSTNNYPSNFLYNTEGTPDASIIIDRSSWNNPGLLEFNFSSLNSFENPWADPQLNEGIGF